MKRVKNKKEFNSYDLIVRYSILIFLGIFIGVFYKIFAPLTIYPVYFILNLFYPVYLLSNILMVNSTIIEIISACIASSAYYLFVILNLSTTDIETKKRIKMLLIAFLSFLILNILRIVFLSILYVSGSSWFDFTHELFWYLISVVFVVGIWFAQVKYYKIKTIPFYSDLKVIYNISLFRKKS
jgi:exosortase/archaeosortase family protein